VRGDRQARRYTWRVRHGALRLLLPAVLALAACHAQTSAPPPVAPAGPVKLSPAEIAERATPSIVSIRTPEGLGTGFVVKEDGWIVTNLHVVAGAERAVVALPDKKVFPVLEVMNASPRHDLVILRIGVKGLPVLPLGKTTGLRPGEPVVAIGHPLGLSDTVSNGLLSAIRKIDNLVVLQVSAPIAPGSSGGPIFNEQGEVIGVATAILSGGQNLNLGLPSDYVQALVDHPEPMSFEKFARAMAELRERLQPPARKLAKLPLSVFQGCNTAALRMVGRGIGDAIAVGAPLYNQGNHRACYQIYQGAASDIENRLPKSCVGPKRTLAQGRSRAADLEEPSEQAWAMRDVFDSLVEALKRRGRAE
jgi:serine protease Do